MRRIIIMAAFLSIACQLTTANAQEEEGQETYIYATYYYCDVTRQDRADEIVESIQRPVYDAAVADGTITGWGWLVHHTGGQWRRAQYFSAPSVDALLEAQSSLQATLDEGDSGATDEFGQICNAHDDYIWHGLAGNGGDVLVTERGNVGLSAYYLCNEDEARADELVTEIFAPIYNAHVGDGMLTSWGWSEHIIGGEYRRLSTMTAEDWPTLFSERESLFEEFADIELADQSFEICGRHADYMWEIQIENP